MFWSGIVVYSELKTRRHDLSTVSENAKRSGSCKEDGPCAYLGSDNTLVSYILYHNGTNNIYMPVSSKSSLKMDF